MSTVTQRIPNFLLGISQQPDNRKFPGQLNDCVNAFPDYALGLLKRPGGQFQANLQGATPDGKWFSILRDPQEKYVAQYDDNVFRVWDLTDGSPRVVDMGDDTGVPGTCNLTNYQTDLDTYNTAVETTATRLAELHAAQADFKEKLAGQTSSEQSLFEIKYYYTPPSQPETVFDQYFYTGILKTEAGIYIVKNADTIVSTSATLPDGYRLGIEYTDEYPVIASQGYRIYEALQTVAGEYADSLTITAAGSSLTDGTYEELETATTGSGQNLTVDIVVSGGEVTTATINALGWDYVDGDTVTLTDAAYSAVSFEYQSDVQEAETAMGTAQTNYDNAVTAEATALTDLNTEIGNCAITTIPADGYLNGATADDIEVLTLNDYTFVLNKARTVAMDATTTAARPNEAFFVTKIIGQGHYRIFLDGVERATDNGPQDADELIATFVLAINGQTFNGTTFTATAVGPGMYISADAPFTISAVGGPGEDSVFVFTESVSNVSDLPLQCHDGYKVKVVNSVDIDADDMYVEFVADDGAANGPGVWEESNDWGITFQLDPLTLPHQLVRQADGSFTFGPIAWEDRLIGDLETNPNPSFVGATINNLFFYRNRLGFLSNEAVVLSKAGDYFNFFATTALTVSDDDPIDVNASSVKPVNLRYVRPSSAGLVLFSDTEQFLIAGNDDILSPKTVRITELSSYECDPNVEAVTLGTSLAFISKTPLYSRLYEIGNISITNPPAMVEQTQYVPELVPATITNMIASPALSLVSMGTTGNSTIYQYRFVQQGEQRGANTWYKWDLTGTLLDQFFDISTYYAVVANGTDVYVQSYDLTQASEEGYLTLPTGEKTDVCLDLWHINPYREYDPDDDDSDITRIRLPYDEVSGGTFSVVLLGRYIGAADTLTSASVGAVLYPTVESDADGFYADIAGDYRGRDMIIGYTYNMEVDLPKFFVTQVEGQAAISDFTSDLIIHRIKVSTGLSGPVKYQISITGRPEWNQTIEAVQPYVYDLNNVNLSAEAVHTVPIYQRNENLSLKIIGDSPLPVTLLSLNWEGRYKTGFYRRS